MQGMKFYKFYIPYYNKAITHSVIKAYNLRYQNKQIDVYTSTAGALKRYNFVQHNSSAYTLKLSHEQLIKHLLQMVQKMSQLVPYPLLQNISSWQRSTHKKASWAYHTIPLRRSQAWKLHHTLAKNKRPYDQKLQKNHCSASDEILLNLLIVIVNLQHLTDIFTG